MEGVIVYNRYNILGEITENTEAGIFGTVERIDELFADQKPLKAAGKSEIVRTCLEKSGAVWMERWRIRCEYSTGRPF